MSKEGNIKALNELTDEKLEAIVNEYHLNSEEFETSVTIYCDPDQYVMARIKFVGPYKAQLYNPKENVKLTYKNAFLANISKEHYDKIQSIITGNKLYNVEADVSFYIKTPTTTLNKSQYILAEKGIRKPVARRDCDNMAKLLFDSLHGVCYTDDCYITKATIAKYNSSTPRIEIKLKYKTFNEQMVAKSTPKVGTKEIKKKTKKVGD